MVDYNFKPRRNAEEFGWYSRGYLPHFDGPQQPQFLTFRLYDSMPQETLEKWRVEVRSDIQFRKRVESYLDAGYGSCWLRRADVATVICDSLKFHHTKKYDLESWVVMPNHAHVLLTPFEGIHLDEIEHSIKSYTANEANKLLARKGRFWAIESFDRYIRNRRHYNATIRYIENNPVKARLCQRPEDWLFSSAAVRWKSGT
jgi:REP element-mobilizing transposase RayT